MEIINTQTDRQTDRQTENRQRDIMGNSFQLNTIQFMAYVTNENTQTHTLAYTHTYRDIQYKLIQEIKANDTGPTCRLNINRIDTRQPALHTSDILKPVIMSSSQCYNTSRSAFILYFALLVFVVKCSAGGQRICGSALTDVLASVCVNGFNYRIKRCRKYRIQIRMVSFQIL